MKTLNETGETITVWITKYALSKRGVFKIQVEICNDETMVQDLNTKYRNYYHGEGRDWHRTRESALKRVEVMKKRKISSLQKQLQKLEEQIEIPE